MMSAVAPQGSAVAKRVVVGGMVRSLRWTFPRHSKALDHPFDHPDDPTGFPLDPTRSTTRPTCAGQIGLEPTRSTLSTRLWIWRSGAFRPSHPSLRLLSIRLPGVSRAWVESVRSLLEAPSPAVLTTYRKDGSAHTVPVWYRWTGEAFEVVVAKGDVKLRHLARNPRCVLVAFEVVRPFRGVEARGVAELVEGDVASARVAIAGRYLGLDDGERFAAERRSRPGVLLRLVPDGPRVWDLSGILPS